MAGEKIGTRVKKWMNERKSKEDEGMDVKKERYRNWRNEWGKRKGSERMSERKEREEEWE